MAGRACLAAWTPRADRPMLLLLEDVGHEVRRPRIRARLRKGEGIRDFLFHLALDPDSLGRIDTLREPGHGIVGLPGLGFLGSAIAKVVIEPGADVLVPAVG